MRDARFVPVNVTRFSKYKRPHPQGVFVRVFAGARSSEARAAG